MKKYIVAINIILILSVAGLWSQEEVWYAKGEKAFNDKDYTEAINSFTRVIELKPDNKDALYFRGLAYLYKEDAKSAAEDFTKVINLDSSYADAYNNRGLCLGYIGQIGEAIDDFKKAIILDPRFSQAYVNLGSAYLAIENYDDAMDALNKVVDLDKKNAENYFLRGSIYMIRNKYDEAIRDFTKAIDLGLAIGKSYFNRGNAYYKSEKYIEAISDLNKVIQFDSTDVEAINNRSIAYSKLGLDDLAAQDRRRIELLTGGELKFKDVEELHFVKYSFLSNNITIELPENWFNASDTVGHGEMMIIAKDTIFKINEAYHAGVRMALDSNMYKQYNVITYEEILSFWEYNAKINESNYKIYNEITKINIEKDGYKGYMKEAIIKIFDNSYPLGIYEVILVKNDKLFYSFFQAPEAQWEYYKKIYKKAIDSLRIGV